MPELVSVDVVEWSDMVERLKWLDALEAAGVDNWQGIETAHEIYEEMKGD